MISLVLSGKSADSVKVISMTDEIVTLLKAEQGGDDGKKAYCIVEGIIDVPCSASDEGNGEAHFTGQGAELHSGANRCRASSSDSSGNCGSDPAHSGKTNLRSCC